MSKRAIDIDNNPMTIDELQEWMKDMDRYTIEEISRKRFQWGLMFQEAEWRFSRPICENPMRDPVAFWTSGGHSSYNGGDRLGLQLDAESRLHIVYEWRPNWSDFVPPRIERILEPDRLFKVSACEAKKAVVDAIVQVFNERT